MARPIPYQQKTTDLLTNAAVYHANFYQAQTFSGPSLHFHQRALATWNHANLNPCLEHIYATLASWGMHRMGQGGSKMKPFADFTASVIPLTADIVAARAYSFTAMTPQNWGLVERIFKAIEVMASNTSLVGNSKVMAHLMPNIIPPIDRNYTLKFLKGDVSIKNDLHGEWLLMREIIEKLFIPVASDPNFALQASIWMNAPNQFPWDTSIFKVIDNLIIGAMK